MFYIYIWARVGIEPGAMKPGDRVSEDAWLSTFASPESARELQRRDKNVTTNWISQNWGEKGVK